MSKSKAAQLLEQFGRVTGRKNEDASVSGEELDKDGNPVVKDESDADSDKPELDADGNPLPKKDEDGDMNAMGEMPTAPMQAVKEEWAGDPEKEKAGVDGIVAMSESKHPAARKFMEALDAMTCDMDIEKRKDGEVSEDADAEYMVVFEPEKWAHLGEKFAAKKK